MTRDSRVQIAGVLREYFDPNVLSPTQIEAFHRAAGKAFEEMARDEPEHLEAAIEAEYHSGAAGFQVSVDSRLIDGALATAQEHYRAQRYDEAARILDTLLRTRRTRDVVRLAAHVAARRNQSGMAIQLAREVLVSDPRDTRLLADLSKIALSQYQDDTTVEKVIDLARSIGVEDVSISIVEARMLLRRHKLQDAERVLVRARQITRFSAWPYYYLGVTYFRMGRIDDAIEVLEDGQEFFYRNEGRSRNALNAIRTQLGVVYLFANEIEAAGRVLDLLIEEDPSPEVARAYAALTIRRDGIQQAERAFARLSEASIRNRFDRCQFHLFYGLFQRGIGNVKEAELQFAKAHAADKSNVYVMMKWARALYELATEHYSSGNDVYETYVKDCGMLVKRILGFDTDNREGIALLEDLNRNFDHLVE